MHPDGSGVERLTDDPSYDDQAAFSPDGNRIVFVSTRADGKANLWILDVKSRKATPLTTGAGGDFRPAWSPDGQWIAFSSDRGSSLEFAKGRWEHLHLVDIYLIRPDGTGLKQLSHGDFCGSPKWSGDSASVVVYCMPAEDTWTFRVALRRGGLAEGDTTLKRIDIATGEAKPVDAGPGVKMFPSILPSGEVAYLRADVQSQGVFTATGKPGPSGDARWPAFSPDGKKVVYGRETSPPPGAPRKLWSKNPKYELFSTGILPAYDRNGERYVATAIAPNRRDTTLLLGAGDGPPKRLLESKDELIIAPQWSPRGDTIIFGIGKFASFLDFAIGAKKPVDPANGGAQIATVNADGSGFRKITSGANNNGFASYAPDGERIVYRTMGPDGSGLRIMNLKDGTVTPLTAEYDNFPDLVAARRPDRLRPPPRRRFRGVHHPPGRHRPAPADQRERQRRPSRVVARRGEDHLLQHAHGLQGRSALHVRAATLRRSLRHAERRHRGRAAYRQPVGRRRAELAAEKGLTIGEGRRGCPPFPSTAKKGESPRRRGEAPR